MRKECVSIERMSVREKEKRVCARKEKKRESSCFTNFVVLASGA
jgi:hypothetical protein